MFYSQCNQDKYLQENVFKGYKNGFFMDIGAHDGVSLNNTLYFEQTHNWTGINVEPIANVFEKLKVNRPLNINLNYAVCNEDGLAQFVVVNLENKDVEMLSGLQSQYDKRHDERINRELRQFGGTKNLITVPTKRVDTICSEYNISRIHYLSIDVQGAEFEVIKSIDFDKVFIDVIQFENNYPDVSVPIVKYLETHDYVLLQKKDLDIFMIHKNSIFKANLKS